MKRKRYIWWILAFLLIIPFPVLASEGSEPSEPAEPEEISYLFWAVKGKRVILQDEEGKYHSFLPVEHAKIHIDGRPVKPTDFKRGMEVFVEAEGGRLLRMESYSAANPGLEEGERRLRTGIVIGLDEESIRIRTGIGTEESYPYSAATLIRRNSRRARAEDIVIGDRVRLTFTDSTEADLVQLDIVGDYIRVRGLYRAKLAGFDKYDHQVTVMEVEKYENGQWQADEAKGLRLAYHESSGIYMAGQKLRSEKLNHYKGKRLYFVMKDQFGEAFADRILIQSQYESLYNERIDDIRPYTGEIELSNKRNLTVDEGSVLIASDRIIGLEQLSEGSSGLIIADGRGPDKKASLVYIYDEKIGNALDVGRLYAGRLDTVLPESLTLRDFSVLNEHQWESFSGTKEFFLDDDTALYDYQEEAPKKDEQKKDAPKTAPKKKYPKKLSLREFYSAGYSADESSGGWQVGDRDWHAYLYCEGDRVHVAAVRMELGALQRQDTSIGVIGELDFAGKTSLGNSLTLRNGRKWNRPAQKWQTLTAKNPGLKFFLKEATIIKNGERIEERELKLGDTVYMVHQDNRAVVIFVK